LPENKKIKAQSDQYRRMDSRIGLKKLKDSKRKSCQNYWKNEISFPDKAEADTAINKSQNHHYQLRQNYDKASTSQTE